MVVLEVVIGLVFAFLLLSLLGTIIQEFIAALLSMRGKVLLDALVKMIEQEDDAERWKQLIRNSRVYQKYAEKFLWVKRLPSYLSADQAIAILQDIFDSEAVEEDRPATEPPPATGAGERSLAARSAPAATAPQVTVPATEGMRDLTLRHSLRMLQMEKHEVKKAPVATPGGERSLAPLAPNIQYEVEKAKRALARNFNDMMERTSGWYKQRVQYILLLTGLVIAVVFDADTIKMYNTLAVDTQGRQEVLAIANTFVSDNSYAEYTTPSADSAATPLPPQEQLLVTRAKLDTLIARELTAVRSPLGLGWEPNPWEAPQGTPNPALWKAGTFLKKLLGWVLTALAISLGAPFWFDLLKLLMNIRSAGNPPKPEPEAK